jgi:GTP cyclohydrolase I
MLLVSTVNLCYTLAPMNTKSIGPQDAIMTAKPQIFNPNIISDKAALPDVSHETAPEFSGTLSKVGMERIELPVLLQYQGKNYLSPALINAYVSLDDPEAKGIHMSRLYLELKNRLEKEVLSMQLVKEILQTFLNSHKDISKNSYLEIHFQLPLERKALKSEEKGYRQYPVIVKGEIKENAFHVDLGFEILYSSTCPCSAALSRRLLQDSFITEFGDRENVTPEEIRNWLGQESSINAVPHAQRSIAKVFMRIENYQLAPEFSEMIDKIENALGTPVQSAVKRVDEQEFARLNAANLMFCEDAARKIKSVMEKDARIIAYDITVDHQESLHPHNAVSRVVKGY